MWANTSHRPLSLSERIYLAEVLADVRIRCVKPVPAIIGPLFGQVGPFEINEETALPLFIADLLSAEHYCKILAPIWLTSHGLKQWIVEEQKHSNDLLPPPHNLYIEIANKLLY
ncbi:hypothetical protein GNI_072680, partial [Gregarina niphandrodes]